MAFAVAARRWAVAAVAAAAVALPSVRAAARQNLEYQVKAAYLFNFLSFIEWPSSAYTGPTDPIRVCVIGFDPFGAELDTINGERVGERRVVVERLKDEESSGRCRLLFVSKIDEVRLPTIRKASAGRGVLIVTETPRSLQHCAGIALVLDELRVRFDVNMAALRSERLVASSKLLRVARQRVDFDARCQAPVSR